MALSLLILGSGAAAPTLNRHHTAQLLQSEKQIFLIDCGEGTQLQLRKYNVRFQKINHIFISHLHGDHYFGLVGLLSTMHLHGRKKTVNIYGPKELKEIIELQFRYSGGKLGFDFIFHSVEDGSSRIYEDEELFIERIPMNHRIKCFGYKFQEKQKPRRINGKKVEAYQIPNYFRPKLKQGEDWQTEEGERIKNEFLTFEPHPSHSYVYCSDSAYYEQILPFLQNVNLMYHEATFMESHKDLAAKTYHSTAKQAATLAQKANVKHLLIGHFSNRYLDLKPLLKEAKTVFNTTSLALEGQVFKTEVLDSRKRN